MSTDSAKLSAELAMIYRARFTETQAYRNEVWKVLIAEVFQRRIASDAAVLDLGCGYGEFINNVRCGERYGMDLNPDTAAQLDQGVEFLAQDCSQQWALPDESLDVVFTSNFFEHLPDKAALSRTLSQVHRCLRPRGVLIAVGPNIKYLPGRYWDFFDHYLPLTELSLAEGMETTGLRVTESHAAFLPYTMVNAPRYPLIFVRAYAQLPLAWKLFGKQFLVISERP